MEEPLVVEDERRSGDKLEQSKEVEEFVDDPAARETADIHGQPAPPSTGAGA